MVRTWALIDAVGAATVGLLAYLVEVASVAGMGVWRLLTPSGTRSVTRTVLRKQILFTGNNGLGTAGMLCAVTAITMLFFGQRVAKDYQGAAVLVPYFLMAGIGLFFFV